VFDYISSLPKVELHVHLVGSASVDTVLELARRHPERGVPTERDALVTFYEFTDFAHFIDVYVKVTRLLTSGSDITALVDGLAADLASNAVRYAEVTVTPSSHLLLGIEPDELAEALTVGRAAARERHGVELAWVFDIAGSLGYDEGIATAEWVLRHRPEGTVAFGWAVTRSACRATCSANRSTWPATAVCISCRMREKRPVRRRSGPHCAT